jgi:hypothetical protein
MRPLSYLLRVHYRWSKRATGSVRIRRYIDMFDVSVHYRWSKRATGSVRIRSFCPEDAPAVHRIFAEGIFSLQMSVFDRVWFVMSQFRLQSWATCPSTASILLSQNHFTLSELRQSKFYSILFPKKISPLPKTLCSQVKSLRITHVSSNISGLVVHNLDVVYSEFHVDRTVVTTSEKRNSWRWRQVARRGDMCCMNSCKHVSNTSLHCCKLHFTYFFFLGLGSSIEGLEQRDNDGMWRLQGPVRRCQERVRLSSIPRHWRFLCHPTTDTLDLTWLDSPDSSCLRLRKAQSTPLVRWLRTLLSAFVPDRSWEDIPVFIHCNRGATTVYPKWDSLLR